MVRACCIHGQSMNGKVLLLFGKSSSSFFPFRLKIKSFPATNTPRQMRCVFSAFPEIASTSVIQRDFTEKRRGLDRPDEILMRDRRDLGQNVSRENPEKTIQIARRFEAVRTTTRRMAIDPECATRTVKPSRGAGQSGFSQHRV